MTQVCEPKPGHDDVGNRHGQRVPERTAVAHRGVRRTRLKSSSRWARRSGKIFSPLGYDNVHTSVGDGYYGWPEVSSGFDIIMVTCAAEYAPPELFKQMKPGGKMIIPIGQPFKRGQVLYIYTKDEDGKIHSRRDVGVFFIPMTGAIQKTPSGQQRT